MMMDIMGQGDIGPAFERMARERADALVVSSDPLFSGQSELIATLATELFADREDYDDRA